jgi:transcriptional regulator with XRE-family HTH domain
MASEFIADDASLAQRIGARLRGLRTTRGLTLAELSKQSGVSVSYLSAVEKGTNLPSLQILARLTEALGASIPAVLAEEGRPQVQVGAIPASPGAVIASHPLLQLETTVVRGESGSTGPAPVGLDGKDVFVYVVSGTVDVVIGERDYRLGAGDAIDTRAPVSCDYTSVTESVVVWSACPARPE